MSQIPRDGSVPRLPARAWPAGAYCALATGYRLQRRITAAQGGQASGALALHQSPQRLLEQGAALEIAAQLLSPGQQLVIERHGGAHGFDRGLHHFRHHLMTAPMC